MPTQEQIDHYKLHFFGLRNEPSAREVERRRAALLDDALQSATPNGQSITGFLNSSLGGIDPDRSELRRLIALMSSEHPLELLQLIEDSNA